MKKNDFGKFGAYVQQDDILVQTQTVKETLTFAAQMRTSLNPEQIEEQVLSVMNRLRLLKC